MVSRSPISSQAVYHHLTSHSKSKSVSSNPEDLNLLETAYLPTKNFGHKSHVKYRFCLSWLIVFLMVGMGSVGILHIATTTYVMSRAPWGTTIDGINIGGIPLKSIGESLPTQQPAFELVLTSPNNTYRLDSKDLMISKDYNRVLDTITATLSSPLTAWRWWILSIKQPTNFRSPLLANRQHLAKAISNLAKQELVEGRPPNLELKKSGDVKSLVLDPGENGFQVDETKTIELIQLALSQHQNTVDLSIQPTQVALTPEQVGALLNQAQLLVGKSLTFTLPDQPVTYKLNDSQLVKLINLDLNSVTGSGLNSSGKSLSNIELDFDQNLEPLTSDNSGLAMFDSEKISHQVAINQEMIAQVIQDWSKQIDRSPQDPVLDIDINSLKVNRFVPPLDGLVLDQTKLHQLIARYLNQVIRRAELEELAKLANDQAMLEKIKSDSNQPASTLPLPLSVQPPTTSLASTNPLGINEKIGHGQSRYTGSISTRIHNVSLATSRVNLIILKPGQEFRFNDQLGDVSSATGFKPAYIIRSGRTELGDGGGVCQVSTTLFRAALDAGLPITKRLPHSYRVSYYELDARPGIDATVFAGEVDLRFVNNTPAHILIYGQADPKTLTMYYDIYGTNDGRTASITDHITWAATPPPPPEYIYDPSLAPGERKQVDWSAPGLKAKFTYTVIDRDGIETHKQTFISNYRPWSAKFLVGTPQ